MKEYLKQAVVTILICGTMIGLYHAFLTPPTVVIERETESKPGTFVDLLFNDGSISNHRAVTPGNFIGSASKARPAVVYIRTETLNGGWESSNNQSAGSGVIVSPDGYIVTNHHVIEDGLEIQVTLEDRRTFKATTVGVDLQTDLALLKIEAEDLPFLLFGNSDSLQVGEWVLAVGNPFRLQSTVTAGIVSAKGRDIDILQYDYGIESFIQTDAAINPGNSGGALVNTRGELVGISTAILTYSGRYEGYSFAIPSNLARKVINDLREYGSVHRGLLGIEGTEVTPSLVESLNLDEVSGIVITLLFQKGGASEAGMKTGDVILEANGVKTRTMADLLEQLGRFRPGDQVIITYSRNGKVSTVPVTLKNQLHTTDLVTIRKDEILTELGFEVRDLIALEKRKTDLEGVKVISIYKGSTISETRMEPGYIITRMNDVMVKDTDTFVELLTTTNGRIFLEGYYEKHGGPWWYAFEK